ncbi:MAG TPA: tyrosine-protein kinase, partial [Erwinia sp.]|nr:tyrosine-protein kinase [Erwinia sp.]
MNIKSKAPTASKEEAGGWDLAHLVGQLVDHRWIIVAVTAFFLLLGTLYTLFATPIYSADSLVQVEQKSPNTVLTDLTETPVEPASATEIQIIQSRMVIGKTVDDLGLNIQVEQNHFPVLGKGFARLLGEKPAKIAVSRLDMPKSWKDSSVKVEVTGADSFTVSKDGNELFKGKVGQFQQQHGVSMLVSGIDAEPGSSFTVTKLSTLAAIGMVTNNLAVADKEIG